ncbi:hypothetical protein SALWKB29_0606 [Snodgrassella communis]|uniref:Uncharacterized protein n=1 Tax=Snodgrassella communis TaxID=2946699 RepID=A0A837B1T7_9NEIS|nr:hypothetical protein SALWKB29_0606 [Snodgrassella communis]
MHHQQQPQQYKQLLIKKSPRINKYNFHLYHQSSNRTKNKNHKKV